MTTRRLSLLVFLLLLIVVAAGVAISTRYSRRQSAFSGLDMKSTAGDVGRLTRLLAARPHRAGSEANTQVAERILSELKASGFSPSTQEFRARIAEPVRSELALTAPLIKNFPLYEKAFVEDSYSSIAPEELLYFAYAPDADVEAEVIYANYGSREDYEYIRSKGIDPAGKIAIVRSQGICRGMKAIVAEEQRVAGLLMYPELKDQGFLKSPYPEGPHTNPWVAQRGSLLRYFLRPGSPDPGSEKEILSSVPAIPISGNIAGAIFGLLQGTEAPADWVGWMKVPYNIGPGPARVRLTSRQKLEDRTVRNVLAELRAEEPTAPWIIVGCHYDAWVYGASDPVSGASAVLKTAQILGQRYSGGWRPKFNVLFAFWDAEEPGMFGSSEWIRRNPNVKIAAYLNVDSAYRSPYFVGNLSPGMGSSLLNALAATEDPITKTKISETHGEFPLPGFSSDTGPFIGYTGAPIAEIGFGINFPMYHSIYDDLHWMEQFGDPGYRYHATLVKILGLYLEQFADSEMLPYGFQEIPEFVRSELLKLAGRSGVQTEANEPAALRLEQSQQRFEAAASRISELQKSRKTWKPRRRVEANLLLVAAMHSLQDLSGARGYGRGTFYGASATEGCPAFPFPGAQEAAMAQDLPAYRAEIVRISEALDKSASYMEQAIALLAGN